MSVDDKLKANISDLLVVKTNLVALGNNLSGGQVNLSGAATGADRRLVSLTAEKKALESELATKKQKLNSLNKDFLENIYSGNPEASAIPTLQDLALLVFWFGWVLLIASLFTIRVLTPGTDWKMILITLGILVFATIMMYAMLRKFA